jgi:hypothetical protein
VPQPTAPPGNVFLNQAMKACSSLAAPLKLNLGARWGLNGQHHTPTALPLENDPAVY